MILQRALEIEQTRSTAFFNNLACLLQLYFGDKEKSEIAKKIVNDYIKVAYLDVFTKEYKDKKQAKKEQDVAILSRISRWS